MDRFLKLYDATLGITNSRSEERIRKLLMGLIAPALPFLYGLSSVLSEHSKFIGRRGFVNLSGFSAVAAGVAYLSLGLLLHVHNCWADHPRLAGVADAARGLLALVFGVGVLAMFYGVLF